LASVSRTGAVPVVDERKKRGGDRKSEEAKSIAPLGAFDKSFEDEDEALSYAIHNQRDRRNLTDADLARQSP
jgi:hypothetical protein